MAELKLRRVFVALPVAKQPARRLFGCISDKLDDNQHPVCWRNYHITLAFLGALSPDQLISLRSTMSDLTDLLPQNIEIGGLSPFPKKSSAIMAAIVSPTESLRALHSAVILSTRKAGIEVTRPSRFRPHITLARCKRGLFNTALPLDQQASHFQANTLGIYEGHTTSEGYRYQCLFSIARSAGSSSS